jgi:phosphatidylglycerophosphate synthase
MERPRDLRAICQAGKGGDPGWYVIHRRISIYVTWVVLRAGISLGSISFAMLGLGVVGAGLVAVQGGAWNAFGFAFLYFVFLLDKVDGEVARYRGIESVHGILLDRFYHRLVEPALFVAVALHQIGSGANVGLLAAGLGVALLANVIDENQHLAPYILLKHLRETGRMPSTGPRIQALGAAAARFRPLKMFRMFIIAVPAFAMSYVVQAVTGWPAPTYYLFASLAGLTVYLAFQCAYYYGWRLDAEIAAIRSSFPGLSGHESGPNVARETPATPSVATETAAPGRRPRPSRSERVSRASRRAESA